MARREDGPARIARGREDVSRIGSCRSLSRTLGSADEETQGKGGRVDAHAEGWTVSRGGEAPANGRRDRRPVGRDAAAPANARLKPQRRSRRAARRRLGPSGATATASPGKPSRPRHWRRTAAKEPLSHRQEPRHGCARSRRAPPRAPPSARAPKAAAKKQRSRARANPPTGAVVAVESNPDFDAVKAYGHIRQSGSR